MSKEDVTNIKLRIVNLEKGKTWETGITEYSLRSISFSRSAFDGNFGKIVWRVCFPAILREVQSVVDTLDPTVDVISYIDSDGDKVLLDDKDSYVEAIKYGERVGNLVLIVEQSERHMKMKKTPALNATAPKLDRGDVVQQILSSDSPSWVHEMMEKMKAEVKDEIFESLDKRSADYKKKFKQMVKQCRAESNPSEELQCKMCQNKFLEYYYVCLEKKCLVQVCKTCVADHSADHAMLRLPKNLRSGRRKLAEMASLVLMSKERGPKNDMSCEILSTKVVFENQEEVVVFWEVKNRGSDWKKDVKLECLANSNTNLWPIEPSVSVGPLKSGHISTLEARLRLIDAGVAGNYSTFWILTIRGFRFCSLSAEVIVKPIVDESYVVSDAPQLVDISEQENVPNVSNENHVASSSPLKEQPPVDDELELFLRSEELKLKSFSPNDDDLLSQYSCVSSNSSVHDDFDFELVTKNVQMSDDGTPARDDPDSYVIATPLNTSDETDNGDIEIIHHSTNLTEFFNQLTSSLSTLASETHANRVQFDDERVNFSFDDDATATEAYATSVDLPVVDPRINDDYGLPILETEPLTLTNAVAGDEPLIKEASENELFFMANEETPLLPPQQPNTVAERTEAAIDAEEEERRELEELARSVENFQIQPPATVPKVVETQNKPETIQNANKTEQPATLKNDPVAAVLTTALRVSSQALSTVSNVLQAVANHTPRQNSTASASAADNSKQWQPFRSQWVPPTTSSSSTDTTEDWQPPKAWVPKATQTLDSWTPPRAWTPNRTLTEAQMSSDVDQKLAKLNDMGFTDQEKNLRLLLSSNFDMEMVISLLLTQMDLLN